MSLAGLRWPQLFAGENITSPLVLSRNVWAGAAAHGTALWSSDIICTWNELAAQLPTGLSAGLSGAKTASFAPFLC
jgi:alpha-glucosidase (family GH31 glycosyl hydrolase)